MEISTDFSVEDLRAGIKLANDLHGVPFNEAQNTPTTEKLAEKYSELSLLSQFMRSFDSSVFAKMQEAQRIAKQNQKFTDQVLTNLAFNCERATPLLGGDSGDDDNEVAAVTDSLAASLERGRTSLMTNLDQNIDEKNAEQLIDEEFGDGTHLMEIDTRLKDEEYVNLLIEQARRFFNMERGRQDTRRANLSDIKTTTIETPAILQQPIFSHTANVPTAPLTENAHPTASSVGQEIGPEAALKSQIMIDGNIKALVPLFREHLESEQGPSNSPHDIRYKRGTLTPLREKRIFGVLTKHQVGFVPNMQVNFTDEETQKFVQDTYGFKTIDKMSRVCEVNLDEEMYQATVINSYQLDPKDQEDQPVRGVATLNQLETFHRFLVRDLYKKRDEELNFDDLKHKEKKYFLVPLRLQCGSSGQQNQNILSYGIDTKLLLKVEQISQKGYKACQPNILQWMAQKKGKVDKAALLDKWMLVKYDKPHSIYHFSGRLLEDLENMRAEEFAEAVRGEPKELGCETAYELLFKTNTRFKSINSFREILYNNADEHTIRQVELSPIILLDPVKIISGHKFVYSLQECSKNPNRKQEYKRQFKQKNNLTTSQGRPIFSAYYIYRHYMKKTEWMRAAQLPNVLAYFERALHCHSLIAQIGEFLHPEFILWATSAKGMSTAKRCYETLETYGDTILKLASTLLAYDKLESNPKADEKKINDMKNSFVTNLFLFRIGQKLRLREFMRTKDPDPKIWSPPFTTQSCTKENISCTGKNIADCVESLLGAFFMSTNLFRTLRFISDIQLVPLQQAKLLALFPDKDLTFMLGKDLDAYAFDMEDTVSQIYHKYFTVHSQNGQEAYKISDQERAGFYGEALKLEEPNPAFGSYLEKFKETHDLKTMGSSEIVSELKDLICDAVEKRINYKFNNKNTLLEAFTHRSFKDAYGLNDCYEKLEVLGDAILDYIVNSNLIKFTMFEKYNVKERREAKYITPEDFQPFDAHQAKSLLTKNSFLAKLIGLFSLQEFILYDKPKPLQTSDKAKTPAAALTYEERQEALNSNDWKSKKQQLKETTERETDKYFIYSFRKDFKMNQRDIELFEASKILGDVFESLLGAIFLDGGIESVVEVYQHMLAPFCLFVAKFSKKLNKEPKEDLNILAGLNKIIPEYVSREEKLMPLAPFLKEMKRQNAESRGLVQPEVDDGEDEPMTDESIKFHRGEIAEQADGTTAARLIQVDVLYNNNQVMSSGYGNTRKQAERNASINGLRWMTKRGLLAAEAVAQSGATSGARYTTTHQVAGEKLRAVATEKDAVTGEQYGHVTLEPRMSSLTENNSIEGQMPAFVQEDEEMEDLEESKGQ